MRGIHKALTVLVVATVALPVSGIPLDPEPLHGPSEDGKWGPVVEGEVAAINMALMPNGEVLYYSGIEARPTNDSTEWTFFTAGAQPAEVRVFDPDTGEVSETRNAPDIDLFCSGTTVRPDGDVLTVGGTEYQAWMETGDTRGPVVGLDDTFEYHRANNTWNRTPSMDQYRWYPSVIELADGGALAASGIENLSDTSTHNALLEVRDPGSDEWRTVEPTIEVAPGVGIPHLGEEQGREAAVMNLPLYPRLFTVPGGPMKGDVFYSTVGTLWGTFGERPEEELWSHQQVLDPESGSWTVLPPSVFGARQHGNVVPLMVGPGDGYAPKLLTFGGTLQRSTVATAATEIADLSTMPPTNDAVDPMHHARWHANGILLPTGKVLAVGGGTYDNVVVHGQRNPPVMAAEQFDPATGEWEELASMEVPRMYHSTAVLVPDGRVLTGGHVPLPNPYPFMRNEEHLHGTPANQSQIVETRLELFEPPYLHRDEDTRPAIAAFRAAGSDLTPVQDHAEQQDLRVGYGEPFRVVVDGLDEGLGDAVLVRPGSTTHAFDADQRGIRLDATVAGSTASGTVVQLTAPPDGAVAPPGHYMLFVNEDVGDGYPSEAIFVQVGPDA